jgi:hypothetical protein
MKRYQRYGESNKDIDIIFDILDNAVSRRLQFTSKDYKQINNYWMTP